MSPDFSRSGWSAEGFKARVEAFRQAKMAEAAHDDAVPFYLIASPMALVTDRAALIDAIKQSLGALPVAVVIDTLNRSLAGSESDDRDMAAYVQAPDAIRSAFACSVIVVHHCGHEGTRPGGHSSLIGSLDAPIAVRRDAVDNIVAAVEFMRNSPASGPSIPCKLLLSGRKLDEAAPRGAKVEWHPGELYPRVGFIVTNMSRPAERVVAFYAKRGKCEQWIKEGKGAIKWTRLSCRSFAANAVRLQLYALAYNLCNFLRTLATPEPIQDWSLTSLKEKLIKIGAKVISHGRIVAFQMAEVGAPRRREEEICKCETPLSSPAAQEMRAGPLGSDRRIWVQTATSAPA
jgi:hypothetical protein